MPHATQMEGMPYDFNWGVDDEESGNSFSHVENSDGKTTQGEYRVLLPDGRTQVTRSARVAKVPVMSDRLTTFG